MITSIIESSFANKLGIKLNDNILKKDENIFSLLFNEISGGFIVSISPKMVEDFKLTMNGHKFREMGILNITDKITYKDELNHNSRKLVNDNKTRRI